MSQRKEDHGKTPEETPGQGTALHPPDSPDLSPCDFWFFGMVKENIKDREICSAQEIVSRLSNAWSNLTLKDIQRVFLEWMDRLTCVIENDGEYFPK
jgi:histone-lysine N-methyltransferase SETMAR